MPFKWKIVSPRDAFQASVVYAPYFHKSKVHIGHKDFAEGVRALLVDKSKDPKWNPNTLPQVRNVKRYFEPFDKTFGRPLLFL